MVIQILASMTLIWVMNPNYYTLKNSEYYDHLLKIDIIPQNNPDYYGYYDGANYTA